MCVSACLLTSCINSGRKVSIPEPQPFCGHEVFPIEELINPANMAFCHDKLVLVNQSKGKNDLLYFYNPSDISFCFSALKLGNGNQEVIDMNPAFFKETSDGFILNTRNWMGISSFSIKEDGIEKIRETAVAPEPMNGLLALDDGRFVYKGLSADNPFTSQVEGEDPIPFGKFPKPFLPCDKSDLFNIFDYTMASSPNGDMMAFFRSVPKVRIYRGTRLVAECEYESVPQKVSSMDDFYDGVNTSIYFVSPKKAGNHVYVMFLNKTIEQFEEDMSMQLLQLDEKGMVLSSWAFDEMFMTFAVSPDEQYLYAYKETEDAGEIHRFRLY